MLVRLKELRFRAGGIRGIMFLETGGGDATSSNDFARLVEAYLLDDRAALITRDL
jgi:hypothetical protein